MLENGDQHFTGALKPDCLMQVRPADKPRARSGGIIASWLWAIGHT